ncbi:MAG: hypothetical protein KJO12_09835, partial [Ignavibacteria bacterium]|nr:hypothetical protein [Ignavibacteria bacterium]
MSLDISSLNSFSKEVYSKIIPRHPGWEKYAKLETFPEFAKPDSNTEVYLLIEIPSPVTGIFPIEITTIEDVEEEITIYFGPA